MLGRLRHPNIVQLLAIATSGNHLYVCTEFVDGVDLESLIFEGEKFLLAENDKHNITLQVLQAVAYIHAQRVVHQDIKPANVLVTAKSLVTQVCDLGFGKLVGNNGTITSRVGNAIANPGTPLYMAPECLLNMQKASHASDMWSTAATIIELYTSIPYWNFSDDDFAGDITDMNECLIAKVKRAERPGVLQHSAFDKVPASMQHLLNACLQYDCHERPTALELIQNVPA